MTSNMLTSSQFLCCVSSWHDLLMSARPRQITHLQPTCWDLMFHQNIPVPKPQLENRYEDSHLHTTV